MSDQSAQQLAPILEANPTLIGLATFVIGIIVTIWTTRFAGYSLRETLEDPASRATLIADYRKPGSQAYFQAVTRVLTFADRFYGTRLISWQSFGRCLTLAYIYPVLAALLGWVIYNAGSPGGLPLFSEYFPGPIRALVAGGLVISWAIAAYVASKASTLSDRVADRAQPSAISRTRPLSKAVRETAGLVVIAGGFGIANAAAFVFIVALALAFAPTTTTAVAAAFPLTFAVSLAFAFAAAATGARAFSIPIAAAVAFPVASPVTVAFQENFWGTATGNFVAVAASDFANPKRPNTLVFLVFAFALLPLLNAIADTLSVAITRKFLGRLNTVPGTSPGLRRILAHLVLDLLLAFGCLILLLASLRLSLDLWGWLSPDTLPFDWRVYIDTIRVDWGHGTALYLMVFTTLIPTLVHVIAGLGAVLTHRSRMLSRVADALEAAPETLSKAEINRLVAQVRKAHFLHGTFATGFVIGGFWLLWRVVGEVLTRLPFPL